jgi:hypothetical protein
MFRILPGVGCAGVLLIAGPALGVSPGKPILDPTLNGPCCHEPLLVKPPHSVVVPIPPPLERPDWDAAVDLNARKTLDDTAKYIHDSPYGGKVVIAVYVNGSRRAQGVAQTRARSIARALVARRIDPGSLDIQGHVSAQYKTTRIEVQVSRFKTAF